MYETFDDRSEPMPKQKSSLSCRFKEFIVVFTLSFPTFLFWTLVWLALK